MVWNPEAKCNAIGTFPIVSPMEAQPIAYIKVLNPCCTVLSIVELLTTKQLASPLSSNCTLDARAYGDQELRWCYSGSASAEPAGKGLLELPLLKSLCGANLRQPLSPS